MLLIPRDTGSEQRLPQLCLNPAIYKVTHFMVDPFWSFGGGEGGGACSACLPAFCSLSTSALAAAACKSACCASSSRISAITLASSCGINAVSAVVAWGLISALVRDQASVSAAAVRHGLM